MSSLCTLAPRLYKAHCQRKEELRALELQWAHLETRRVELEALVAHRDLQLVRAYARNSNRYIKTRQDKLAEAEGALKRCMKKRAEVREKMKA